MKAQPPKIVYAQDIRELKKALQKVPAVGSWHVEQGPHGFGSIITYDAHGNRHTIIHNKP